MYAAARFPKDGLLSQAETCRRTNQRINNTVQQVGIDSLWIKFMYIYEYIFQLWSYFIFSNLQHQILSPNEKSTRNN